MRSVHRAPTEAQVRNAYKANEPLMKLLGPKHVYAKETSTLVFSQQKAATRYIMMGNGHVISHQRSNGTSHIYIHNPAIDKVHGMASGKNIHDVVARAVRQYTNALARRNR